MNRQWIAGATLVTALVVPGIVRAHEGHEHKVMGTVTMRHDQQLEVKTTDGKTVTIVLNDKTAVLRGKTKLDLTAVKQGDRVVVDLGDGKEPMTAKEIKLGEVAAVAKK